LRRCATVSAHQSARAQLDAAKPANHQNGHPVAGLTVYGLQDGAAGGASGLAIIVKAILLTDAVRPAIMGGIGHVLLGKKRQRLVWVRDRGRKGKEPALADDLFISGGCTKGMEHRLI